jgi:hypothetical protein
MNNKFQFVINRQIIPINNFFEIKENEVTKFSMDRDVQVVKSMLTDQPIGFSCGPCSYTIEAHLPARKLETIETLRKTQKISYKGELFYSPNWSYELQDDEQKLVLKLECFKYAP